MKNEGEANVTEWHDERQSKRIGLAKKRNHQQLAINLDKQVSPL